MTVPSSVKISALVRYAALAVPLAFSGLPLFVYAPDLYTSHFGVKLGTMGILLLALRLADAVQDPLLGYACDRYAQKRFFFLGSGMALLGVSFAMLYHPAAFQTTLWFCVSLFLAMFAFSLLTINYLALGSLWNGNAGEKTRITAAREGTGLLGLLLATLIPALLQTKMPVVQSYSAYAFIFIGLLLVTGGVFLTWLRKEPAFQVPPAKVPIPLRDSLRFLSLPSFRLFYCGYGLSMMASSIPAVLVIFFIRDRLVGEAYTGLFLCLYFLAGIAGMPFWKKISDRRGKGWTWIGAMGLAMGVFAGAFFLGAGDLYPYACVCLASGLALGAELALPPALLSELIAREKQENLTALCFSVMALTTKVSLALASGLSFIVLAQAGFRPALPNSHSALLALSGIYAVLPCLIKGLAMFTIYRFNLRPNFRRDQNLFPG